MQSTVKFVTDKLQMNTGVLNDMHILQREQTHSVERIDTLYDTPDLLTMRFAFGQEQIAHGGPFFMPPDLFVRRHIVCGDFVPPASDFLAVVE
ncbi:MAG: hypothetical protein P8Y36_09830 [Alphaproteobacteria bacterium]